MLIFLKGCCCKPPSICEMQYVNATFWEKEDGVVKDKSYPYDSDCDSWSNDDARFLIGCMKNRDECRNGMERR
jgi:hypothetical protein